MSRLASATAKIRTSPHLRPESKVKGCFREDTDSDNAVTSSRRFAINAESASWLCPELLLEQSDKIGNFRQLIET
jgi:hypothetical protein